MVLGVPILKHFRVLQTATTSMALMNEQKKCTACDKKKKKKHDTLMHDNNTVHALPLLLFWLFGLAPLFPYSHYE